MKLVRRFRLRLRSHNLNSVTPYMKLNGDTSSVGLWVTGSDYATVGISRSFTNGVPNVTGLVDPAPNAVYQSVIYNSTSGVGSDLRLSVRWMKALTRFDCTSLIPM